MFLLVALKRAGLLVVAELVNLSLGGLLGLLGEEDSLDVGEDTALSDGHTGKQLVQLLDVLSASRILTAPVREGLPYQNLILVIVDFESCPWPFTPHLIGMHMLDEKDGLVPPHILSFQSITKF